MFALLLFLSLGSQSVPAQEPAAALAAQDARFAAMVSGDAAYLEKALDASLTYQHSTGTAQTKDEFIQAIRAGGLKYKAIDVLDRRARRFGAVVIITGTYRLQATNNVEVIDTKARFTDVYLEREGRFVQVAWQNTRMPQ
jgi:hypothetical protein